MHWLKRTNLWRERTNPQTLKVSASVGRASIAGASDQTCKGEIKFNRKSGRGRKPEDEASSFWSLKNCAALGLVSNTQSHLEVAEENLQVFVEGRYQRAAP